MWGEGRYQSDVTGCFFAQQLTGSCRLYSVRGGRIVSVSQLRKYVLRPDIVEGALTDAIEILRPQGDSIETRRAELEAQLRGLDDETGRLTAAIATGGEMSSLLVAVRERERQRGAVQQQLDSLAGLARVSHLDVGRIERDLRARVKEWRALLQRQAPVSRQIVTKLLGPNRLIFAPQPDRSWVFTGRASFDKLLQGIVLPQVWRPTRLQVGIRWPRFCATWPNYRRLQALPPSVRSAPMLLALHSQTPHRHWNPEASSVMRSW